ncbi:MAG: N-acetylmuramoyl-L-alanine amidase, partial [Oscillospiraceae bacterium]
MLVITILLAGVAMFFMGDSQSTSNSISSSDNVQENGENSTDKLDDTLNSSGGEESSEINSDGTSSDETSSDGTSSDVASSDGASSDGTSSDGASSDGTSSDENSGDLTTSDVTFNVPSEMRAVYMTPGEDYFLKSDDSEETIKSQIDTALKRAQDLSMNSVVFITKLNDKTIYANSVLPTLINGFDALDYAVKKAKEMAFYTYAIYDAGDIASDDKIVNAQIIDSETIDFVTQNLQMFSKNYHFDGIIIDNYYNNSREESFNQYVKYGGGVGFKNYMLSLSKTLFQVCADTIRINSPGTQVGMMTEAVWENTAANENGSNTAASYTALGSGNSDNVQYINDKIPDFVLVKALNSTIDKTENFETVVNWWDNVMKEKDLSYYVLHASSKAATDNAGWSEYDQLIKQAMACEKLNCFNGSVFNSLQRLIADPKSSTTNLIKYYNKEINPDHVLKELAVTRPTKLQYETFEPSVTFRGASDPNTEVTINGKKIPTDQNGYFAAIYDLIPGDNVFTIDHKGKSVTYKIYRRVVIIKEFTPTGNMSVDGEMEITVSALAYADAKITATLNGKTIELVSSDRQNDDTDLNSNYKLFEGSFTVPPAKAKAQKLGNITFNGNWEGMKENKTGAAVTVNKKAEIANGRPVRVVAAQAETFSTDILNDHSNPHYYPLPSGTLDYAVGSEMIYNDGKKTFSYYKLASNLRVYTADITAVENGEGVKNNVINSTKISSDKQFTYVTIDMNQKASYVARYDGNTFTVKFNYTTKLPSSVDVGTNPMFTSSSYNGEVLTLNLAKSGGFLGYKAYYSGDNLVFRFNNPPQISGSSLEGVRISIDAGHGGIDPGAAGFLPAYPESVVNYQIAYKLYNELASRGASVQLIYTNSGELTMAKRISMAQQNNSHLLISVHANSARSAIGTEAYYFYPFSKNLAAYLSANVSNALVTTNRGAKYSYMYMTRCSQFASALIETGFLSNEKEYKKLISDGYQEEIAYAMADSITSYLKSVSTCGNYGTVTNPPVDTNTSSDSTTTPDVSDKEVEMIEFEEEKVTVGIDKSVQLKVN